MVTMVLAKNNPGAGLVGALALSVALHVALLYGIAGEQRNVAESDGKAEKKSVIEVNILENLTADAPPPALSPVSKVEQALVASPPAISRPLGEKKEQTSPSVSAGEKNTDAAIVATTAAAAVAVTAITTFAKALTPVRPAYPATAREGNITGRVTAKLLIDETGTVVNSSVVNAEPAGHFEASALVALRSTRFSPATRNGVAVKSEQQMVVTYRLE